VQDVIDGTACLIRGDLPRALEALTRAAPDDRAGVAHHNLALALRATGDLAGATRHAERAVALAPRAPSLSLLASLRLLAGAREAAVGLFRRALAVDPTHAPSLLALGLVTADAQRVRAALPGLSPLLAERAAGQLLELEAGGRLPGDLCRVPLVSEVLGAGAPARDHEEEEHARRSAGRTIDVAELSDLLARAARPVALTGAGLSTASGLRTRKQLWETFDRDRAVSVWKFREDPRVLWAVVRDFLGDSSPAPNAAHLALARLPLLGIVTQNVDGLHQAAGSRGPVVELHGSLEATRCDACGARGPACRELLEQPLPSCVCGEALRPDVVLFGEWVARERLAQAAQLASTCDLLLVVGTAADVSPAADLPRLAAARGAVVVEVKRRASRLHHAIGTLHLPGAAEDVLPRVAP
jgi:NAD-dependent deacetylase